VIAWLSPVPVCDCGLEGLAGGFKKTPVVLKKAVASGRVDGDFARPLRKGSGLSATGEAAWLAGLGCEGAEGAASESERFSKLSP
jgi:hypothetical protein